MKKVFPLSALLILLFAGSKVTAQSKWLFVPGIYVDNPFENEIGGGGIFAGVEYRPKVFFGLETRVKYGFYGYSDKLFADPEGGSGIVHPNGFIHYRLNGPQVGIVPRFYYDLDIFYDGLSLYGESEFSFGMVYGDIDITGDAPYEKTFSEPISYYSVSVGLEFWEDNSFRNKRDIVYAASVGLSSWVFKDQFNRHIPDSYDGSKPLLDVTLTLSLTLKVPIGSKSGSK